jgi:FkbM family methyltransferase
MNRFRYKRAVERLQARKSEQVLRARTADLEGRIQQLSAEIEGVHKLASPFAATFPDGSLLCHTIYGLKYFVDPEDLVMTPQMIAYRQWEPELSRLIYHSCTPDMVFVDVGANIGYFTCLAAAYIRDSGRGRVFAFEPNPRLVPLLRRNAEINWSLAPITIHPCAVGDTAGTASLQIPEGHAVNATFSDYHGEHAHHSVEVEVVRLDDVLPKDLAVDFLKIDVEGHELSVLRGAANVIARSPAIRIVIEWSITQIRDAGVDPTEFVALFAGFQCYNADLPGDIFAEKHDPEWLLAQPYMNVLLQRD